MKFSIIMPIYNVEKYLKQAIDSVVNQTYKDFELVLVDDGSPDNCPAICDEYAKKDNRVKVIHKENGGLSSARNAGVKQATGDYIIFIDSDDYLNINLCEKVATIIEEQKPDIVQYEFTKFIDGEAPIDINQTSNTIKCENGEILEKYVEEIITREAWNKAYKKELFDQIEYPVGRIAEDLATTYLILEKCRKVICIDEKLYYYRVRKNSIMAQGNMKLFYYAMLAHFEIYTRYKDTQYAVRLYSNYYNNLLKLYAKCYFEKNNEYICEAKERLNQVQFGELNGKSRFVYILYKLNDKILLRLIYKKYVK